MHKHETANDQNDLNLYIHPTFWLRQEPKESNVVRQCVSACGIFLKRTLKMSSRDLLIA